MNLNDFFDIKNADINTLTIDKWDNFNCRLRDLGKVYKGFLLAKSSTGSAYTICEIDFQKSATDNKYQARLTFRRTRQSLEDMLIPSNQDTRRIPFETGEDGYREFWKMISFLSGFKELVDLGEFNFRVQAINVDSLVINDTNKAKIIENLLNAGYSEEVWEGLSNTFPSLATKFSYARIQEEKLAVLNELNERLVTGDYSETAGTKSWQKWIYKNSWLFGANYNKPIEKVKVNLSGIMPDFIFPTIDGFVDILEIKLPIDDVIVEDRNHIGSWKLTPETNIAIGQVINYLSEIDRLNPEIEKLIAQIYNCEIRVLKPRAFVLIGNSSEWTKEKKDGLRKVNYFLHNIQIITYKELLERGNQSIKSIT